MKIISYSLFGYKQVTEDNLFEFRSYLRGFYFNCRMNHLIYPEWITHVEVDQATYTKYQGLFDFLKTTLLVSYNVVKQDSIPLCEGMFWRMKPIFKQHITHVICRDSDSITTYKEAQCVQRWLESDLGFHAINDNPAHGGMMGGMVGFNTARFKARFGWQYFEEMIQGHDLSKRGSDQNFMNKHIHTGIIEDLFLHKFAGAGCQAKRTEISIPNQILPQVDQKLWESNLTCRHIGSAGVVDMETLRFFQRFDAYNYKFKEIEKEYPEVFYWRLS